MSLFTTQLQTCLEAAKMTRVELSEKSAIPYKTLSNYATGIRPPDTVAMRAICGALPDHLRYELLAARITDEVPVEYRTGLIIQARQDTLNPVPMVGAKLPEKFRRPLEALGQAMTENKNWEDAVLALANCLEPEEVEREDQLKFTEEELIAARATISATARAAGKDRPRSA